MRGIDDLQALITKEDLLEEARKPGFNWKLRIVTLELEELHKLLDEIHGFQVALAEGQVVAPEAIRESLAKGMIPILRIGRVFNIRGRDVLDAIPQAHRDREEN